MIYDGEKWIDQFNVRMMRVRPRSREAIKARTARGKKGQIAVGTGVKRNTRRRAINPSPDAEP